MHVPQRLRRRHVRKNRGSKSDPARRGGGRQVLCFLGRGHAHRHRQHVWLVRDPPPLPPRCCAMGNTSTLCACVPCVSRRWFSCRRCTRPQRQENNPMCCMLLPRYYVVRTTWKPGDKGKKADFFALPVSHQHPPSSSLLCQGVAQVHFRVQPRHGALKHAKTILRPQCKTF